jgi:hypothetical protein
VSEQVKEQVAHVRAAKEEIEHARVVLEAAMAACDQPALRAARKQYRQARRILRSEERWLVQLVLCEMEVTA